MQVTLPDDVWINRIFPMLSTPDRLACAAVCKRWYGTARHNGAWTREYQRLVLACPLLEQVFARYRSQAPKRERKEGGKRVRMVRAWVRKGYWYTVVRVLGRVPRLHGDRAWINNLPQSCRGIVMKACAYLNVPFPQGTVTQITQKGRQVDIYVNRNTRYCIQMVRPPARIRRNDGIAIPVYSNIFTRPLYYLLRPSQHKHGLYLFDYGALCGNESYNIMDAYKPQNE